MKQATRLYSEAAQENCDGPEYDLMQQAADCICELIAERDELLALLKDAYGYTTASTTLLPERIKAALDKAGES